jgi:NAD(P)-dependent dehydrogenase (short-subunit alcohol dehydrogenase family)
LKQDENGIQRTDFDSIHYYQRLYGDAWIDLCERSIQRMKKCEESHEGSLGGTIIGISSPSVNPALYKPDRTYSGPGSGKTIMEYSMRIYAKVVAEHNINVNVIVPGIVPTEAWARASPYQRSDESMEDMMQRLVDRLVPLKQMVQPTDIGEVISFLCSPSGKFITGMALPVDGGQHIN